MKCKCEIEKTGIRERNIRATCEEEKNLAILKKLIKTRQPPPRQNRPMRPARNTTRSALSDPMESEGLKKNSMEMKKKNRTQETSSPNR